MTEKTFPIGTDHHNKKGVRARTLDGTVSISLIGSDIYKPVFFQSEQEIKGLIKALENAMEWARQNAD